MLRRHFLRLAQIASAAMLVISAVFALGQKVRAVSDECSWTGSVSTAWATADNWQCTEDGTAVPENGDTLIFPEDASNKNMNNDLDGLQVVEIVVDGDGYTFSGNSATVSTLEMNGDSTTVTIDLTVLVQVSSAGSGNVLGNMVLDQEGSFLIAPTGGLTIDGVVSGAIGSFRVTPSGTLTINENATFTTDQNVQLINSAVVTCNADTCLGAAENQIITFGSGRIDFGAEVEFDNPIEFRNTAGATALSTVEDDDISTVTVNGDITVTENAAVSSSSEIGLDLNGEVSVAANKTLTYKGSSYTIQDGSVTGAGNLVMESSRVYLRANNTYTGTTTIKSHLWLSNDGTLGDTSTGTVVESGGEILVTSILGDKDYAEPLTLTGHGITPSAYSGAITNGDSGDDITFSGPITLNGDTTIHNTFDNSTLIISGVISGTGDLTIGGGSGSEAPYVLGDSQALGNGSPNTFDGDMIINGSSVTLAQDGLVPSNLFIDATSDNDASVTNLATGALDLIPDDAVVTLTKNGEQTATLTYGGMDNQETIGGLSGDGTVTMLDNIDIQTLTLNVSGNETFSGDLTTNILNKTGTGTQTLAGDVTVDTVNIGNGNLIITGETNANFVVNEGSTLKGTGQIGNATVSGTLAPGMSPGIITVSGNLDLTNGSLDVELDGTTVGTEYDQTVVTGSTTLSNTTLNVLPGFTPNIGTSFTILRADTISGTFTGLNNGAVFAAGGTSFRINYNLSPSGEDTVTLTVVATSTSSNDNLANTGDNQAILVAASIGLIMLATVALIMAKSFKPYGTELN